MQSGTENFSIWLRIMQFLITGAVRARTDRVLKQRHALHIASGCLCAPAATEH